MGEEFRPDSEGQRLARERYRQAVFSRLATAMTAHQQRQLCRAVVEQALVECTRVAAISRRYGDRSVAEAVAAARAWLDHGAHPGDAIERRLDDFYNPFWLTFSAVSSDPQECALAAAYCTERAARAAHADDWVQACREAILVVDVAAQATGADREAARQRAERWQIAAAWAILYNRTPPRWPPPPLDEEADTGDAPL